MADSEITLLQLATRAKLQCPNLNGVYVPPEMGADSATLFIIGEAPGEEEEEARAPFVGPSGSILRAAVREAFGEAFAPYITNAVKYRPATTKGNRTPTEDERLAFRDLLKEEIRRVRPKVVMALGNTAGSALSGQADFHVMQYMGDGQYRTGREATMTISGHTFGVVPCVHPSFVLRSGGVGTHEWARFVQRFRVAARH